MNDLLKKFKPFKSELENNVIPQLAFDGQPFPEQESYATFVEDPNNSDSFVVVNRGKQADCETIEEHINDVMQECLKQYLFENSEEIVEILQGFIQAQRESRLKSLGYEDLDEERILYIRSGRNLI